MSAMKQSYRPCVVVANHDVASATDSERRLRRLGWDVYQARSGPEARRLVHLLEPELVFLSAELSDESGWLTCAKLSAERPEGRIVLMGEVNLKTQARARMVGASSIVASPEGLASVLMAPARAA